MTRLLKHNHGITIIALVITIIVLLILAGVTINLTLNNNGIVQKSGYASNIMENVTKDETNTMEKMSDYIAQRLKKEGITGLVSDTEYKINGNSLLFNKIISVGEDESIKSLKDGFDYLCDNGYKENCAILLKPGNYDTKDIFTGASSNINSKYNEMEISIIAEVPGETYISSGEMMLTENNSSQWIKLKFYRVIFSQTVYGNGFHLGGDEKTNEYYNCVFLAPVGGWNGRVSDAEIGVYNCAFLGGKNNYYSSSPLNGIAQNCVSNTNVIDPLNGTKITCLENASFDLNYNIISEGWENAGTGKNIDGSQAHIGVYGGEFAWNNLEISIDKENKRLIVKGNNSYKNVYYKFGRKLYSAQEIKIEENKVPIVNNKAIIDIENNGLYSILVEKENGYLIKKIVSIENFEFDYEDKYMINNTELKFKRIITVGNTGEQKSLKDAFDYLYYNNYMQDCAILLQEGSYTTKDLQTGVSSNLDKKYDKMEISIIGDKPGKVFLSPGEFGMSEIDSKYGMVLKFYRIVFKNANGNFHLNMDNEVKEYYNCVFETPFGGWNGKVKSTSVKVENCVFNSSINGYYDNRGIYGTATNCASTNTYMEPYSGTKITCLTNVEIDSEYNIISEGWENTGTGNNSDGTQANIGVYGGKYSW